MHLSLPKQFLLFILASSICKSLQCLISALTQGGGGGHLFRLTCSAVLWRGRNTANKYHWAVWGVLTVSGPHQVCPRSRCVRFPGLHCSDSQVALQENCLKQALGCVHFPGLSHSGSGSQVPHKGTDSVGPAFCALSRSKQLRQPGAQRPHSPQMGRYVLLPPLSQLLGFLDAQRECCLRCAVCLLWGADLWLRPSW